MRADGAVLAKSDASWPVALIFVAIGVAALLAIYYETVVSIVSIWWRSETFAHGFLILPISLWLIHRQRASIQELTPQPDYVATPVLVLLGLLWLVGRLAGVLVVEQYAWVLMIPAVAWLVLGWAVVRRLAFPLGFLLFAVPNGDFLVPPMMDFTADFTVKLLQWTGIPVYREGTFFSIPSGDWSVVEGCSGLRYFIASVTLGVLYAYLSYRSLWRRLAFVALSVVFPVIANGLRAYMIVMIAHLSDMQLALGVDHLIYGWVFFGLVMLLLFWLGSFMAEPDADSERYPAPPDMARPVPGWRAFAPALALALGISLMWPARAAYVERLVESRSLPVNLILPEQFGPWRATTAATDWMPDYEQPDAEFERSYTNGSHVVTLYVEYYRSQEQGAELISSRNMLVRQKHAVWRMPSENPVSVRLDGAPGKVREGLLQSQSQQLLTWRWNRFGSTNTISGALGKFLEARDKMLGRIQDAAGIVIATETGEDTEAAAKVLQQFVDAMLPVLQERLDAAAKEAES